MRMRVVHDLDNNIEVRRGESLLLRYEYAPDDEASEVPKPYLHPLRTLRGNEVTHYRPHDHVWHKGLAMTSAQLSGQNFWGGPTYVRDKGYVQLDNTGRMEHREWDEVRGDVPAFAERLDWIPSSGETWISERRNIEVSATVPDDGYWSLDLRFHLENVSGNPLVFGSPTTEGRPMAGYGGLFWRGPRSFTGGEILAAGDLEGPETMGESAPWLAYVGAHDGNLEKSTIVFLDHPSDPRFPNKWFVRNDPYACVSCSFMFDEEYTLEPEDTLDLQYQVIIGDGAWSREEIEDRAKQWLAREETA